MHVGSVASLCLLVVAAGAAAASEKKAKGGTSPPTRETAGPSLLSEVRFGFSAQDPWGPERGSAAVAGEVLLGKPFTPADLFASYFVPRPHFGGSLNFDRRTSHVYAGLTWSVDVTPRVFVEGALGGGVQDGQTDARFAFQDRPSFGCSPVFRQAGSVGMRLSGQWSLVATLEHLSQGGGACAQDRGLTNLGARFGYAF